MVSPFLAWLSSLSGEMVLILVFFGTLFSSFSVVVLYLIVRRQSKNSEDSWKFNQDGTYLYTALFRDNHQVLMMIDPDTGLIVDANKASCEFYGYSKKELIGKNINKINILTPDEIHMKMQRALSLNKFSFEFKHKLANGEIRDVEVYSGRIIYKGRDLLFSAINDISDRIRNKEALVRAVSKAESANRSKSEFLANMSHEVRTPLNGAMGMLQLLTVTEINNEQTEYVEAAYRSCTNLMKLLSELLDLSKIEAGKVEIQNEEFSFSDVLRDIESNFSVTSKSKGLELILKIDNNISGQVLGDPQRIRQILFNLVGNAIKFTDSGYVMVEISALPPLKVGKERILISVQDTGRGIPDNMLEKVFEAFTQLENSYSRKIEGAGLGLQIVKRLLELMGGTLAVESEEGTGSTFMLSFEVEKSKHIDDKPLLDTSLRHESGTGAKILLVEDDPVNMKVISTMLRKSGMTVETAANGRKAVEKLSNEEFDLVLMDIQMPEMDGVSATKIIRNSPKFDAVSKIPIIALTAYVMSGDKEKFVEAGMDDYISKPVDYKILMDKVSKYCSEN